MAIRFINIPLNLGCNRLGVEQGGKYICDYGLKKIFTQHDILGPVTIPCKSVTETRPSGDNDRMKNINNILDYDTKLAEEVLYTLKGNNFPLVFGGDHSLTWGSLSGASKSFETDIGCIYLDAHGDFNSAESSPSGNVHGMHMYYLMGYGEKQYVDFYNPGRKINPKNVYFLGTRSLDYGEQMLAEREKFNIFSTSTIHHIGVEKVFQQLAIAIAPLQHIHFSLDIDSIDPIFAPGTGVPEQNGLTVEEVEYLITKIFSTGKVVSMDIVEFNPLLDSSNRTLNVCIRLLKSIDKSLI